MERAGLSRVERIVVDRAGNIGSMGEEGRVSRTPPFILDIEHTYRDLLLEQADPAEEAIDRRTISFAIAPTTMWSPIAAGAYTRFRVNVKKTLERLKARAARRSAQIG